MSRLLSGAIAATALAFAVLSQPAGSSFPASVEAASAPDPAALERLVRQDCGSCHGLTLKGGLGPDIRPEALAHYDAEVLTQVILDGVPDTPMPPWRPLLTEAEAAWIAAYLLEGTE